MRRLPPLSLVALAPTFLAVHAHAHISLDEPKGRYWSDQEMETDQAKQKQGPCGVSGDRRTTNSALVTTYRPGQTITVRWTETVPHEGHFRIAFLQDGQNFPVPTGIQMPPVAPVLVDGIPDPSGGKSDWSAEITLPNVECTNCTLQLMQVMSTSPPYQANDFYFQCADLILANGGAGSGGSGGTSGGSGGSAGKGPTGGTTGAAGSSSGGAAGMAGGVAGAMSTGGSGGSAGASTAAGAPAMPTGGTTSTSGGVAGAAVAGAPPVVAGAAGTVASAGATSSAGTNSGTGMEEESGCALPAAPSGSSHAGLWSAAALAWAVARRRRQRG
jgi:hypothetical protein